MSPNKENVLRDALNHRLYAATKPKDAAASITYTNATTKGLYVRPVMASPRADADAHLQHLSLNSGAQIERCV